MHSESPQNSSLYVYNYYTHIRLSIRRFRHIYGLLKHVILSTAARVPPC